MIATAPTCQPPDPGPVAPNLVVPAGATDTHMHIFGPEATYPFVAKRNFTPPDASVDAYVRLHRVLGLSRAVLVQPSSYGIDNRRQLDAAWEMPFPTRIVVVVAPTITDDEMGRLHERGVRGIRFILTQPGGADIKNLENIGARSAAFGWHLDLMLSPSHLVDLAPRLADLGCDFTIDHMGDIRTESGLEQPAFRALLALLESGHCWVKLSAGYHLSDQGPPYRDVIPFVHQLTAYGCNRLLWGSDWPHVNLDGDMPNSTEFLDLLGAWVPDEDSRRQILVDNPAKLYGF